MFYAHVLDYRLYFIICFFCHFHHLDLIDMIVIGVYIFTTFQCQILGNPSI